MVDPKDQSSIESYISRLLTPLKPLLYIESSYQDQAKA